MKHEFNLEDTFLFRFGFLEFWHFYFIVPWKVGSNFLLQDEVGSSPSIISLAAVVNWFLNSANNKFFRDIHLFQKKLSISFYVFYILEIANNGGNSASYSAGEIGRHHNFNGKI